MPAISDAEIRSAIRKVQTGTRRVTLSDGNGKGGGRLQLMVRQARYGSLCEWYAVQHVNGRRRLSKIGVYPETTLAQARAKFTGYSVKIRQGISVKHIKTAPDTLAAMLAAYCKTLTNERSRIERERVLIKAPDSAVNVIGGKRRVCEVTTGELVEWLRIFYARGKMGAAAFNRKTIRAAFNWAMGSAHDYTQTGANNWNLSINPAAVIPPDPAANKVGDRSLDVEEFKTLLDWLQAQSCTEAKIIHLIALTGQRVEEIANLTTDHYVDSGALFWPKTKVENKPHYLPLLKRGVQILNEIKPTAGLYFPKNGKPIPHPEIRSVVKRFCAETGTAEFTTRDLRRTWKTLAGEAGISLDDRDRLQNHNQNSGISKKHYDRYEYIKEKTAAVAVWEAWLDQLP